MVYDTYVGVDAPACILLLVDQSFSMNQKAAGSHLTLAEIIASTVNRIFAEIIKSSPCARKERRSPVTT